ncbi:hypothetical protein HDU76_004762 [Blyttiomyces sp. JEL0837]|nr:hypothetical protein HDU76_004762 [Blyttiomyces sp. JEL0837]
MVNFGTSLLVGLASVATSVFTVQATEIIYLVTSFFSDHGFGNSDFNRYEAWYLPDAIGSISYPDPTVGTFDPYAQPFTATFPAGNYANFNLYQPDNYAFAPAGYLDTMYKTFNCNIDKQH